MLLSTAFFAYRFDPVSYYFDEFVRNQVRVRTERIVASSQVYAETGNSLGKYIIDIERPNRMQIVVEPVSLGMIPERYYYSSKESVPTALIYRPMNGQYVKSTVPGTDLPNLIKQATPGIDELLSGLATGNGWQAFFEKLGGEGARDWKAVRSGNQTKLVLKNQAAQFEITFANSLIRPTSMQFGNQKGLIKWTFSYLPAKAFASPANEKNAYEVTQFDAMIGTAAASSSTAKQTLDRLLNRYESNKPVAYTAITGSEKVEVIYTRAKIYQSDRFAEWTYDGKRLTLYDKGAKKLYDGAATSSQMVEAISKTGSRVEVNLRSLMLSRNPFRLLLNDGDRVESTNGSGLAEKADWIMSRNPAYDIKIAVAKSDGFVLRIESKPKMDGKVVDSTITTFARKNGPIPSRIGPSSLKARPVSDLL